MEAIIIQLNPQIASIKAMIAKLSYSHDLQNDNNLYMRFNYLTKC